MNSKNIYEKEYRLLFTGMGRRVELIQAFQRAEKELKCKVSIYGADVSGTAPALYYCDEIRKVCPMKDSDYIPQLLHICQQDDIDLLIPTIDTDLLLLSEHKTEFEKLGTRVLISSKEKISICRDKNYTSDFFQSCGVKSPITVNDIKRYEGGFPCFIKPKDGSSSINAFRVDNEGDLRVYANQIFDYIIQPFIDGSEFTVDVMCDFDGKPIYIVPRERVAVRSGEVLKTKIFLDSGMIEESRRIAEKFNVCGPMTIQLIKQKETGVNYYIEINPRFGGGAPLSMKAGADSAKILLRLLMGDTVVWDNIAVRDGTIYSRFDQSVCVNEFRSKPEIKTIVFDLDDTLYSEKEYIRSGFKAIGDSFSDHTDIQEKLWMAFEKGEVPIDSVLYREHIFSEELKMQCLNLYRSHVPDIHLYEDAEKLLKRLRDEGYQLGIITDGRPEGQRAKIKALQLENLVDEIVVTDEIGGVRFRKPNDIAFRIMKEKLGCDFEEMMYVGDNPQKDFEAPKKLGMCYCYFKNSDGLYSHSVNKKNMIDSLQEIENEARYTGEGYKRKIEKGIIIIGSGGHGKVVANIAEQLGIYSQIAYLDDNASGCFFKYKILGKIDEFRKWMIHNDFVVAIGNPQIRREIQEKIVQSGATVSSLIHPTAVVAEEVLIGKGTVVMANSVINSGSVIGKGVIINTGSTIDHDCFIGDFVHVAPGVNISGTVEVGYDTWIGVGSCVINNVKICHGCMIGAGAVVVGDLDKEGIYIGIPAKLNGDE